MDESESKKENHNSENQRFSQEQYEMLKRCSEKIDINSISKDVKNRDEFFTLRGR